MKITLETLGCKLNQAETESLAWQFAAAGHEVVTDVAEADVYVLNTCTVTATADAKARHRLRWAHRSNPGAFIVATGCFAQREPDRLSVLPGVGLVVSNEAKSRLVSLLEERLRSMPFFPGEVLPHSLRTRAFVKVQSGCSGSCGYCIVPRVRQRETSVPVSSVLSDIDHRVAHGFKEIVLTGTEVGRYYSDGHRLQQLLGRVLAEKRVLRLRLSSLQPAEITSGLLSLWNDKRLCAHFHLSLQSGSDTVLRLMRRSYTVGQYAEAVVRIRGHVPDAAITTDILVGFPGETDEQFQETLRVCREMGFARIHVFPYSPRPGTEAESLPGAVDAKTKRARTEQMLLMAEEGSRNFRAALKGKSRSVLWERRDDRGQWCGFTDNYVPVVCRSDRDLENVIAPFTID